MVVVFDGFELDTERFELRRDGRVRPIEPQVFDVLAYLVAHRDRVVSKDELLRALWAGRVVTESTLTSRIKAARQAVDDSGEAQRRIATIHRRGYRFVATVAERPAGPVRSDGRQAAPGTRAGDDARETPSGADTVLATIDLNRDLTRLAVIPFACDPTDAQLAWRADTVTEEMSLQLARLPGFAVISRNSTFSYKNREVSARQIGEELAVRYLIEGSVWAAPGGLHVSIQLIDAASGRLLWADRAEIGLDHLPALQDSAVREIVSQIEPQILRAELPYLKRRSPVELGAWSLYRQAQAVIGLRGWCEETFAEAVELLRQAIARSPDLACAHAYLALVLALGHLMGLVPGVRVAREARQLGEDALALDAQDSDVLGYVGCAFADLGDHRRGMGLLERAVELDPSNAQAWAAMGAALLRRNDPKGIEYLTHGMRISPRDNRLAIWGALLARGLLSFGRIDAAIDAARTACRRGDCMVAPRIVLAMAYARAGARREAAAALADARRIRPDLKRDEITWIASVEEVETILGLESS